MHTNNPKIRIAILGINGRMGRMLVQACINLNLQITVATGRSGSSCIGRELGEYLNLTPLNAYITDDLYSVIDNCDVVVDFTTAEALPNHLVICQQAKKPIIIGITGLSDELSEKILIASQDIAIVHSGNYSIGVNLSVDLVRIATQLLGQNYEAEIIEAHHRQKIDAPSGTAFMYAQAITQARKQILTDVAKYHRYGNFIHKRDQREVGLQAIRGGDIVGEHTTIFYGDGEQIEIKHIANHRMNFAIGAIRAAIWACSHTNGLYDMTDVIKV